MEMGPKYFMMIDDETDSLCDSLVSGMDGGEAIVDYAEFLCAKYAISRRNGAPVARAIEMAFDAAGKSFLGYMPVESSDFRDDSEGMVN